MSYLEELIPYDRFNRNDFVQSLKALLPQGPGWKIIIPVENTIRPIGINAGAFGDPTVLPTGIVSIEPDGIMSESAIGNQDVGHQYILPSGIVTLEKVNELFIGNYLALCGFNPDLCSGQFDSEFYSEWYQTIENGEGIAQSSSNVTSRLYPPVGSLLTGNFQIDFGFWLSSSQGSGNKSINVTLKNGAGTTRAFIYIEDDDIWYPSPSPAAHQVVALGPIVHKMRIIRSSSTIWMYWWNGTTWKRNDTWTDGGGSISNSENLYIEVNGADSVNGLAYIAIQGALV